MTKHSKEKTFAIRIKTKIHRKPFAVAASFNNECSSSKLFSIKHLRLSIKIAKTMRVFHLKCFVVYSIFVNKNLPVWEASCDASRVSRN